MFASLQAYADQIVAFVGEHKAWGPPIVFVLAFGELLAFVSLLLPAWAALLGIGVLINKGALDFWSIWIAASLGAAFGDWLSYWIGQKLEYTVQHIWPLSRHPDLIPKGERFVKKWGRSGFSSAGSSGRCAPRFRSSPAFSKCRSGAFRLPIFPPPLCGRRCCC